MCEPTHLLVSVKERGRGRARGRARQRGYNLKERKNNIMLCHSSICLSTDISVSKVWNQSSKNWPHAIMLLY